VRRGGHHVPDEDVVRRFFRGTRNFWYRYRNIVDSWVMYYNGLEKPVVVASGEGESVRILDDDLFKVFQGGLSDDQRP